jgi:hypothetical protein
VHHVPVAELGPQLAAERLERDRAGVVLVVLGLVVLLGLGLVGRTEVQVDVVGLALRLGGAGGTTEVEVDVVGRGSSSARAAEVQVDVEVDVVAGRGGTRLGGGGRAFRRHRLGARVVVEGVGHVSLLQMVRGQGVGLS